MSDKKKVFTYLMGKEEENNSLVRAVEVDVDYDSTVNHIVDFLFDSSKLKTKDVWASLKHNGTKLNEYVTVKDMQSMVDEAGEDGIHLFIYNNTRIDKPDLIESSSILKTQPHPTVFTLIGQQEANPEIQQIRLSHTPKSKRVDKALALNTELASTSQNLVQNRPRKISKKQSLRQKSKDECCLLM